MKKFLFSLVVLTACYFVNAQVVNPVHWHFSAKKISTLVYEVHLTAIIDNGWHTYSQTTPEGGPVPTSVSFGNNPLATITGPAKEVGKLEQHHEPLFGVDVKQFSNKVDLVQMVKLKAAVKTNITGSVDFMACNDHECLPPSTQKFSVALN